MPSVFDVLTSKSTLSGTASVFDVLRDIVQATDFADRHGKQVYSNWLKSRTSWNSFYVGEAVSDDMLPLLLSSSVNALRFMEIVRDCLIRDLHLKVVIDAILLSLREIVSISGGDPNYSSTVEIISVICELLCSLSAKFRSLKEGSVRGRLENIMSFALLKLSVARHLYKTPVIDNAIKSILDHGTTPMLHTCEYLGFGYMSIVRALFPRSKGPLSEEETLFVSEGRIDEELISRKCARYFKLDASIKSIRRTRKFVSDSTVAGYKPSAFDISLLLNFVLCDTLKHHVPLIIEHVESRLSTWTPFELLLIHMAFWNNLICNSEKYSLLAMSCLISCLTNTKCKTLTIATFRFIAIQTVRLNDRDQWRKSINTIIYSVISSGEFPKKDVMTTLQSMSGFYEVKVVLPQQAEPKVDDVSSKRPRGSVECFDTLMQMIKTRKIVSRNN